MRECLWRNMQNFLMELLPVWLTRKIDPSYSRPDKENAAASLIRSIVFIIIFGYFFVRAYMVPTGSMKNTINEKDFLLVNRFIYGVKTPDQIGIPMTNIYFVREIPTIRLTPSLRDIQANDILVFRADFQEPPVEYVKRLVGAPGDSVRITDGVLYNNGSPLKTAENALLPLVNTTDSRRLMNPTSSDSIDPSIDHINALQKMFIGTGFSAIQGLIHLKSFPYTKSTDEIIKDMVNKSLEFTLMFKMDLLSEPKLFADLKRQIIYIKRAFQTGNVQAERMRLQQYGISAEPSDDTYEEAIFKGLKDYVSARGYSGIRNQDDFNTVYIPKEGDKLDLKTAHPDLISNVVFADEHMLDYNDSTYFIDGKAVTEYTVEQDYYFFVGDNRHGSLDSRNWGIIPHKYIIGTPILKYFSVNEAYWQSHSFLEVLMNLDESINWDQVGKLVL